MKRIVSILVAALLLLAAVPAAAAEGLQAGLYVSDSGKQVMYLDEAGVGIMNYYSDAEEQDLANGVLWTGNSLEIERSKISFALNGDLLTFIFDNQVFSLRYAGPNADYALGDQGTAYAGTYAAQSGQKLTLGADGRGAYTDEAGEKAVFWGSLKPYWLNEENVILYVLFDSYLCGLYFAEGGALLHTETGEELLLTRTEEIDPAPMATGLQAGMYVDAAVTELMYLYDNGVGLFIFEKDGQTNVAGILWTADTLEIERTKIPFILQNGMLIFTYQDAFRVLPYDGVYGSVALGDIEGTAYAGTYTAAFAGTYTAEDGKKLVLSADGRGVYTDATGETDVCWGSLAPFLGDANVQTGDSCFILFDSFLTNLTFEGDTVSMGTDAGKQIVLMRLPAPAARPVTAGEDQLYYGYRMTTDGWTMELIPTLTALGFDPRSICLELRADGTGAFRFITDESFDIIWTEDAITHEGESVPCTREGDHRLVTIRGRAIEFAPAAEVEALLGAAAAEDTKTEADLSASGSLVGAWALTKIRSMGIEIPGSMVGVDLVLTLNADGSAVLTSADESMEMEWLVGEDGQLVLSVAGEEGFILSLDGPELRLYLEEDIAWVFEKDA